MFHTKEIATAVVTGHHEYDVVGLQTLFRNMSEIDAYPQNLEDFVTDTGNARSSYEVVVFYNYHLPTPGTGGTDFDARTKSVLEGLGESGQGILVLHHAILAYTDWNHWDNICGMRGRSVTGSAKDQRVSIEVADTNHPITQGLAPWEIIDEVYTTAGAGVGNDILLTTGHPQSMRTIAWAREFGNARVFCYQSGHDSQAFNNPNFQTVLSRGIRWLADRI